MSILKSLFGKGSSGNESTEALFEKGESMLQSADLEAALAVFRRMLKQAESEGIGSKMRDRLYNLSHVIHNGARHLNDQVGGNIYFSAGLAELDAVIAIDEILLEYEPKATDLWSGLGCAYDNRGNCEKAEQCYRRAIELDPGGVCAGDAWQNIGVLYMHYAKTAKVEDREGNPKDIPLAGLKKEQLFPTEGSLAVIETHADSPHWNTAESAFEQALSIFTKHAGDDTRSRSDLVKAHWNLAQFYTELFEGSKAIPHVQEVYRLDPGNQKAINWLKDAERNTGKKLL